MNSSNSNKKEKKNNSPSLRNINNSKKSKIVDNLKLSMNDKKSSEILTTILKGIISLKNNNVFDYIIKLLKLILYYYKSNINIVNINNNTYEMNIDENI